MRKGSLKIKVQRKPLKGEKDPKKPEKIKKKKLKEKKQPLLKKKEVSVVMDRILQGLKRNSQGLSIGEIKKEHQVKIYKLFEELTADPRNQNSLARTNKSNLEIADVIVDYIRIKNKPIGETLNNMSQKDIDLINKLIFKKIFFS